MSSTEIRRNKRLGDLHDLLIERICPPNQLGQKSVGILAPHLGVSYQAIFEWIAKDRIPQDRVLALIKVGDGRVTMEELIPYIAK